MTKTSIDGPIFTELRPSWTEADVNHREAMKAWEPIADAVVQITTWGVISETYTWLKPKIIA